MIQEILKKDYKKLTIQDKIELTFYITANYKPPLISENFSLDKELKKYNYNLQDFLKHLKNQPKPASSFVVKDPLLYKKWLWAFIYITSFSLLVVTFLFGLVEKLFV